MSRYAKRYEKIIGNVHLENKSFVETNGLQHTDMSINLKIGIQFGKQFSKTTDCGLCKGYDHSKD